MTMVRLQRRLLATAASASVMVLSLAFALFLPASSLQGQEPKLHFQHAGVLPPGAIGNLKLKQGGPLSGYFQPVEIIAPRGARVSLAREGGFTAGRPSNVVAGMMIGAVYRLRITHIPGNEGVEVFPSVEV
ncbi:MAG: hypothetical protein KDA42_09955, partial [Planctomycetales bacterium]|nr:hypothetical protein [Planctomycetales bacterium]